MLELQKVFIERKITLSLAESCTGGLIASILTKKEGASNYFLGGVVAYSDQVKIDLLGVSHRLLEEETAVSKNVAIEMCLGIQKRTKSDFAIAVTGEAGPFGKKVGTVFGAIASKKEVFGGIIPCLEGLCREEIQYQSAQFLLSQMVGFIKDGEAPFANKSF
jgi:PncC family amidohydrolase